MTENPQERKPFSTDKPNLGQKEAEREKAELEEEDEGDKLEPMEQGSKEHPPSNPES
jgi:hypothetical protein